MNPPTRYECRIERLIRLTKMILVDGDTKLIETQLMRKIAIALNFSNNNGEKFVTKRFFVVRNNNELKDFTAAIKKQDSD